MLVRRSTIALFTIAFLGIAARASADAAACQLRTFSALEQPDQKAVRQYIESVSTQFISENQIAKIDFAADPVTRLPAVIIYFKKGTMVQRLEILDVLLQRSFELDKRHSAQLRQHTRGVPPEEDLHLYGVQPGLDVLFIAPEVVRICPLPRQTPQPLGNCPPVA